MAERSASAIIKRPVARVADDRLVEVRREQIVDAAIKLVTTQGFSKTTVRQIADAAEMSVGLVYEYIRRKEDILFLIMEHGHEVWRRGLAEALAGDASSLERLRRGATFLVDSASKHPDEILIWYRESGYLSAAGLTMAKDAECDLVDLLRGVIVEAIADGYLVKSTDPFYLATMLVASSHTWVLKGYLLSGHMTRSDFTSNLINTLIVPIASRAPSKPGPPNPHERSDPRKRVRRAP